MNALPIIDLAQLDRPQERAAFYAHLREVARNIGFFYLVGHGVPNAQIQTVLQQGKAFFEQPLTQKQQINMLYSPHFRGYTGPKEEYTQAKPDGREQIDIGAELPLWPNRPSDKPWLQLQGPNLWPEGLPEFKPTILHYQQNMRAVAIRLLRAFLVALGQDEHALDDLIADPPVHLLKLVRYPTASSEADTQGVGAHKDTDILTLLWQDKVGGLQVETDTGWVDVPYVPDSFVINIGEILELATNGYLRANVHRVVAPHSGQDRYSICYFLAPNLDSKVHLLSLPASYAALALGPEADPANPMFENLGANSFKSRLRAHPQVARRHYSNQS